MIYGSGFGFRVLGFKGLGFRVRETRGVVRAL